MVKNYGYNKNRDPNYWLKTSQAIWNDQTLTHDEKMEAQLELAQKYQSEKRNSDGKEKVRKKILENQPADKRYQNIKNKLGLSQRESPERVIQELRRLKNKSDATWKALKLNKEETLREYGIN